MYAYACTYIHIYIYIYTYIRHRAPKARVRVSRGPWECLEGLEDLFIGPTPLLLAATRVYLHLLASICSIIFLIFFWHRFQRPFGPILEPTCSQLGFQNRPRIDPRAIQNPFKIWSCFKYLFGLIFCRFWLQLESPEPSKIELSLRPHAHFAHLGCLPLGWLLEANLAWFWEGLGAKLEPKSIKNQFKKVLKTR